LLSIVTIHKFNYPRNGNDSTKQTMIPKEEANGHYFSRFHDMKLPEFIFTNLYSSPTSVNSEQHKIRKGASPPKFIVLGRRKVSFSDEVKVLEVPKPSTREIKTLWYSDHDMDSFERKYSRELDYDTQSSIAFNHTRRVLLHQEADKKRGSRHSEGLYFISRECSKASRMRARKKAHVLATEVARWSQPPSIFDWANEEVVGFYLDIFLVGVLCGSE